MYYGYFDTLSPFFTFLGRLLQCGIKGELLKVNIFIFSIGNGSLEIEFQIINLIHRITLYHL